ncbi:uncharacterized protein LOC120571727 isoform X1 [Perca fluviatilis]|nr:uncharacterized protein LOC120571727 isoform X1 [Perca fluviatilis]
MAEDPIYGKRCRTDDGPVKDSQSAGQMFGKFSFPQCNGKTGAEYLKWVSGLVSENRHNRVPLKNPAGATWTIGNLEDTIYLGEDDEVTGWSKFYLPEPVNMQVIGVVEGTSCPCEQLVLMTCEDRRVYAYDGEGEELHLVASSLDQLRDAEIEYPASKTYYDGEAFKDMTEEDWAEVRKGDVGKRLDEEHHKLVMSEKSRFLENLKFPILIT